jgi:uncharacterized membrane protein YcaP (DUF421 family)
MDRVFHVDWWELFVPTHSVAEMIVRGTLMYLALFLVFRLFMKRPIGAIGIADVLVIVVIADAAQNAFAKSYQSVTEGIVLVLVIVFWEYAIDWAAYRVKWLHDLLEPSPLPLIKNGKLIRRNLREELLTEEDLLGQLRAKGAANIAEVRLAYRESDGSISVVRKRESAGPKRAAP